MRQKIRHIELLSPARNVATGIAAIDHGADAVYIGADRFGARAGARNSVSDIARLSEYAHRYDARVYATVNTIVYDSELRQVERLVHDLWREADVDALIVQDMSLLRLDLPPVALHSSTQCDLRTPEKARFLEAVGFSQLVMARELTLSEIAAIREAVTVPLEAFCHGALCVSYSGRCQLSQALKRRSANRGECAQMCRMAWSLLDRHDNVLIENKHLLSLRDFNASRHLADLLDSGVSSFKIEGRLKDADYVKNVVAYYRRALDTLIAERDDCRRASCGTSAITFTPALEKSFNRSFTTYFLDGRQPPAGTRMASLDTPKSLGEPLGTVVACHGRVVTLNTKKSLTNGDGLSYLGSNGAFAGFRVNTARGNNVEARERPATLTKGARIYRTYDKAFADALAHDSARRTIAVEARLFLTRDALCLELSDERGDMVVTTISRESVQPARTPQGARQSAVLTKTGNTVYTITRVTTLDDCFIPASLLTTLRRDALDLLDNTHGARFEKPTRRCEDRDALYPATTLESADNVANDVARQFYLEHGVTDITPAIELTPDSIDDRPLMRTRYCIRRELGDCLRERGRRRLPEQLFLRATDGTRLEMRCHCDRCEMTIHRCTT